MTILTLIARLSDGLMLSEAMDSADDKVADVDAFRTQAKKIIKSLSRKSPTKMTVETGNYYFCYIIEGDIVYLTLCERSYPKKLAVKFLEELQKEFDIQYGAEALTTKRPYAFIKFDTFIQKTKKVYADTRSQRNLSKVTEEPKHSRQRDLMRLSNLTHLSRRQRRSMRIPGRKEICRK
eukprot:TRINITY_DN2328_c0_g1_i1.p1 TRINITY_DN2328_c0_g1~~TRINITY_DN2328_c0_g1_i1.p1  ORF type:complete len:179 (+),score=27.85 TRINITY_DN2328_c0_g1_i1:83-619(+)